MSVIAKTAFDSSRFKQKIKASPVYKNTAKGPIKASYEIPNKQWQMQYQYNSPSKTVQSKAKSKKLNGHKVPEESSEYGTMENNEAGVPLLNMNDYNCFNDVTIEERKKRISSILDEIVSIPRLAEANITQRSLSRSSMNRFTGGGSVRSGSSQMSNKFQAGVSRQSNFSRYSSQERKSGLQRTASSPKLNINTEKQKQNLNNTNRRHLSRSTSNINKVVRKTEVPKLNLALDITSQSNLPEFGGMKPTRLDDELSAEFLPAHNTSAFKPNLGNETQNELVLSIPTLGDDTDIVNETDTFDIEKTTDFIKANLKISPKKNLISGRQSAASSIISAKHKTGSVPKYLRARQAEWAEAAAQALASIPDPDCPPGHVKLPDEARVHMVHDLNQKHATLLHELNRLPVSSDTRRVTCRRRELEADLDNLEEEIKKFSRPKVFILPDEIQ